MKFRFRSSLEMEKDAAQQFVPATLHRRLGGALLQQGRAAGEVFGRLAELFARGDDERSSAACRAYKRINM